MAPCRSDIMRRWRMLHHGSTAPPRTRGGCSSWPVLSQPCSGSSDGCWSLWLPVAVAVLLARALSPVGGWLRRRGLRPALAAAVTVLGFLVVLGSIVIAVGASVVSEFDQLGPTLAEAVDDLENWLVEDGPFELDRADVDRWREQAGDALSNFASSSEGSVVSGALIAGEVVVGIVLAIIVTFFFVKDGRRMHDAFVLNFAPDKRDLVRRMLARAWAALGGYLRGAALLGVVESIAIGIALLTVGADLVVPVMALTVLGAFVPLVGAVASLFGLVGTFLAVPVIAVVLNMADESRHDRRPAPHPATWRGASTARTAVRPWVVAGTAWRRSDPMRDRAAACGWRRACGRWDRRGIAPVVGGRPTPAR